MACSCAKRKGSSTPPTGFGAPAPAASLIPTTPTAPTGTTPTGAFALRRADGTIERYASRLDRDAARARGRGE